MNLDCVTNCIYFTLRKVSLRKNFFCNFSPGFSMIFNLTFILNTSSNVKKKSCCFKDL